MWDCEKNRVTGDSYAAMRLFVVIRGYMAEKLRLWFAEELRECWAVPRTQAVSIRFSHVLSTAPQTCSLSGLHQDFWIIFGKSHVFQWGLVIVLDSQLVTNLSGKDSTNIGLSWMLRLCRLGCIATPFTTWLLKLLWMLILILFLFWSSHSATIQSNSTTIYLILVSCYAEHWLDAASDKKPLFKPRWPMSCPNPATSRENLGIETGSGKLLRQAETDFHALVELTYVNLLDARIKV